MPSRAQKMHRKSVSSKGFIRNEQVEHGYFLARKFLVLAPVALASLSLLIANVALAYTSPGKATGYVNDFAHVLQTTTVQSLNGQLKSLQDATGDQITVVTVDAIVGDTIENYANKLFQEWGIGNKEHDNGLLILVSVADREVRIEVGYGLEGTVTDLQSGNIIRKVMIPAFKEGDYDAGVTGAVQAVSDIITGSADAAQYSEPSSESSLESSFNPAAIFFFVIIIFNILAKILGKTKSWWLGGVLGAIAGGIIGIFTGFVPVGIILIIVLTILGLIFDYFISKHPPGPGGSGGIWPIFLGGGRGGSGGGGFGGFGGGMSGGGGASGRW